MHTEHVRLGPDGRIVLPATLRHELGLRPGDALVIESDGVSLLVRPYEAVIRETQQFFRQFPSNGGEIDALIVERRAEAARVESEERDDVTRRG